MKSFKVKCVLVSTILLWASAFVGIKIGLMGYTPGALALFRFLIASLCMALIYKVQGLQQTIPWRVRGQLLIAGMAGIGVYNICLNYGELTVSAGIASFIVGLMPVITVFFSTIFLGERLNSGLCFGITVSLLGLLLLAIGEASDISVQSGLLLILISAFMSALLTIMQKQFAPFYHPIALTAWVMWGGTLLLLMFLPDLIADFKVADTQSTLACIYMGIFPAALAYLAWGYVLKHTPASKASISLYGMPIASTFLGFICLHEMPSWMSLVGGGLALSGAVIAHQFQSAPLAVEDIEDNAMIL